MKRFALLLVALSLVTGCGKIREKLAQKAAEKAIETGSGGDVKISSGGLAVKDKKTGTEALLGDAAKLPDGWPSDVPVYPGAKIAMSGSNPTSKVVMLETTDSMTKVSDFYKAKLTSFQKVTEADVGNIRQLVYKSGARNIGVQAATGGDKTQITITISGG